MSKIERYQGNVHAFASGAQGVERTVFGETTQANDLTSQITASFLRGWGVVGPSEHPSLEDFNGAMYALSQFIAYQHQVGIPEWHEEQEYYTGSVCTYAGVSYQSLEDANTGNKPPSTHWTPVLTAKNGLQNLGLGDGSLLPVGTPIPWPLATPPTGFLKMNGATFDKVANPKLALAYPSGVLPDLRAQTIKGWDDGRGIDTGRALLSEQGDAIRNITGSAANVYTGNPDLATGVISYSGTGITSWQSGTGLSISYRNLNFNAATQVPTAAENRVKSVAFNYIVRAQ